MTQILARGGTAAAWTTANPTLAAREIAVETDTYKIKVGNGSLTWNSLPYAAAGSGGGGTGTVTVANITDAGATGRTIVQAATQAAAWTALGNTTASRITDFNTAAVAAAGGAVVAGTRMTVAYNATTGTITLGTTATTNQTDAYLLARANHTGTIGIADMPAGTTLTVRKSTGGVWPARPTARNDVTVRWNGPDPSPTIVVSGTGGMLDGVDERGTYA